MLTFAVRVTGIGSAPTRATRSSSAFTQADSIDLAALRRHRPRPDDLAPARRRCSPARSACTAPSRVGSELLALQQGRHHPDYLRGVQEAARAGASCSRRSPRVLRRPLAAHPLRGLPDAGRGAERDQQGGHVADRAPNELRRGLRGAPTSVRNLSQVSLASDMVFSDGASLELATMMGSVVGRIHRGADRCSVGNIP